MTSKRRFPAAALLILLLAACSVPRGAAMQKEILRNDSAETPSFVHYEVDSTLLKSVSHWPAGKGGSLSRHWLKGGAKGSGQILVAGDVVQLGVWENGENKLLSNPGAPAAEIKGVLVSPAGTIFVPYVGAVNVAGLSIDAARQKVQTQVAQLIPDAQVQLDAIPGRKNSVDIIGGVGRPGNVPLIDRSLTVLGLISEGGGVQPSIENPQLRLQRAGKVYEISMSRVLDDPSLDAGLLPGDKLIVAKDDRKFLAMGAARREQIISFPKDDLNALEAVALIGGIDANRANPKGVLILREYAPTAVHADGNGGPTNQRVIFSMNLTTADGLFSAQNFSIQPNDVVLATESPMVTTRTILSLFGAFVGVANTATSTAVRVENNL